jgi:hypothetical protein
MKLIKRKLNSLRGEFSRFLHILLVLLVPAIIFFLVRLDFVAFAFMTVLLSKWRMFSVKTRHWPANIRANAVDIFVGLSTVIFTSLSASSQWLQVLFCGLYAFWLLYVKPKSSELYVGLQALIAQTMSLIAIFLIWNEASETTLVLSVWGVTYLSARHFLGAFDEAMARGTAYVWAFFAACLTWLTSHWLLYYSVIAQPALMLTVLGYGMAALYYLQHIERLKKGVRRQFVMLMVAVLMFIIIFSDWSGEII